jgi:transaldolase
MDEQYFERVRRDTGSRFWINNPTAVEVGLALRHGAMGCTTNPGHGGNLLARAPEEVLPVIERCLADSEDDEVVATLVQRRLVARLCERFLPLYESSGGSEGLVSIQGAPEADTDGAVILHEARAARAIAPNATPKIPATEPGLEAFEAMVAEGSPVIVTEVFSLAQLIETCERWLAVTSQTGRRAPFILAPITGILGDHLRSVALRDGLSVPDEAIGMAGVILSRACYRLVREREYPVLLLYGGARTQLDFSGLVGGGMAATINWSTAAELLAADLPAETTIEAPSDPAIEEILLGAFPEMRMALDPAGLALQDFEGFGPVQYFRERFVAGWHVVLDAIAAERRQAAA